LTRKPRGRGAKIRGTVAKRHKVDERHRAAPGVVMGYSAKMAKSTNLGRIAELDGWRGVAILCVVIGHTIGVRYGLDPQNQPTGVAGVLSAWGVDIFFVISGFIITRLAIGERAERGCFSPGRFYTRRFFRIVPAFYFYLLSITVFAAAGLIDQPAHGTALAAVFVCNVPHAPCGWFAAHSWTLAFEDQFYLTFPLIFCAGGERHAKVLLGIFAALVAFPFIRFAAQLDGIWRVAEGFCASFSFICCGAVAAAHETTLRRLATGRFGGRISLISAGFLAGLAISLVAGSLPLGSPAAYLQAALTTVFLPPCLAWLALSPVYREGWLPALLRNRLVQFFGLISYSLYLWQQVFTAEANQYLAPSWLTVPPLMLVAATLSWYGIERPCIRAGRRLLTRWSASPAIQPAGPA
jgi:peptidoglycan/LPS O-acetylase OafA/YrhL